MWDWDEFPDAKLTIQGTTATDTAPLGSELITTAGWTVGPGGQKAQTKPLLTPQEIPEHSPIVQALPMDTNTKSVGQ